MAAASVLRSRFSSLNSLSRLGGRTSQTSPASVPYNWKCLAQRFSTKQTRPTSSTTPSKSKSFQRPFMSSPPRANSPPDDQKPTEAPEDDVPWHERSAERQIRWMVEPEGSKWGWVVYRCAYRNRDLDRHWETFKEALKSKTRRAVADSDAPDIADKLEWVFVEDPALEKASLDELKRRFREFVRGEMHEDANSEGSMEINRGSRYTYFIMVDEEALSSLIDPVDLYKGYVKIVRGWADCVAGGEEMDEFGELLVDNEDWMKIHATKLSPEFYNELENEENWWLYYRAPPSVLAPW